MEKCDGARAKILASGLLEEILHRAISGQISLHREIEPNELEVEKVVAQGKCSLLSCLKGKGASAKVYKAKLKNKVVALKKFDVEGMSFSMEEYRRELALLHLIQHENIVSVCLFSHLFHQQVFWSFNAYRWKFSVVGD